MQEPTLTCRITVLMHSPRFMCLCPLGAKEDVFVYHMGMWRKALSIIGAIHRMACQVWYSELSSNYGFIIFSRTIVLSYYIIEWFLSGLAQRNYVEKSLQLESVSMKKRILFSLIGAQWNSYTFAFHWRTLLYRCSFPCFFLDQCAGAR